MFTAQHIGLRIGRKEIITGCSLAVKPGVFTAVVGPNGAGKTSLLRVMAGESAHYSGDVTINGCNICRTAKKEIARLRAVLPQHTTLNFPFTLEQVIAIGRYPHRTTSAENDRITAEVLEATGLSSFTGRMYHTLSGGEQQRVQLARVLAQVWDETVFPKYLLLDEPTASLDLARQHSTLQVARQTLSRNMGVLAIIHDLNLAAQYADELVLMKSGRIVACGPVHKVLTERNVEETFEYPVSILHTADGRLLVYPQPAGAIEKNHSSFYQIQPVYGNHNYN
jgi:iron complex transport system ATP-binding protein